MDSIAPREGLEEPVDAAAPPNGATTVAPGTDWFEQIFQDVFPKLHRFLDRYSGDHDMAAETAQEAFVRLYRRRRPPDDPEAWVFTVGMNLMRNQLAKRSRRHRLLTMERSVRLLSDPPPSPSAKVDGRDEENDVRQALARLSSRDRKLLLFRTEGHSYGELARLLDLNEASVGTMLKRAKEAFVAAYEGTTDAS